MRKVEFTNLGVTIIFENNQDHIEVRKNNIPNSVDWPLHPTDPNRFRYSEYVSKFRLVDTNKGNVANTNVKVRMEVRYKKHLKGKANNNTLVLGIHNGTKWLEPTPIEKYEIDDRSNKWFGSWLIEVDLPADPMVAWGP